MNRFYLSNIKIKKFRKINNMSIDFKPGVNMIIGHNGTGKSNILSLLTSGSGIAHDNFMPKYENFFKIDRSESFSSYDVCNRYTAIGPDESFFEEKLSFKKDSSAEEKQRVAHIVPRLKKASHDKTIKETSKKRQILFHNDKLGESAKAPLPTRFISISRLMPRGEGTITTKKKKLGENSDLYRQWYNDILTNSIDNSIDDAYEVTRNYGSKKTEMRITDTPATGVSVGQDSLSTIISNLIDFKVASEEENYQGGILAIDEFDISLHAEAQIKLIDKLIQLSKKFNIQIFVTTHSLSAIKYFFKQVEKSKQQHSLVYIKDRLFPHKSETMSYYDIEQSMYLSLNTLPPKINLYAEDEASVELLRLIIQSFKKEFSFNNIDFRPMKVSKTVLKYLNSTLKDPHFQSSMIIYDGDARFSPGNEDESNAAKPEYILGEKELVTTTKQLMFNESILPSGFAPEAYIYHWLHRFCKTEDAISASFWRQLTQQSILLGTEYYLSKFNFSHEEANLQSLKSKSKCLFDFAKEARLFEFIKNLSEPDEELKKEQEQLAKFENDFRKSYYQISKKNSIMPS
ncbi:ATP-dependent nuclease [Fructobacillus cardui]|uniref:ATP-dependent nuclease n=1 Tax=Fructobacillus cardui TaxID=2893170 RepID=UPI00200AD8BF|nr:AAA family ATPase [Fructobacillus cardui]MCK8627445.1 AAA family ATPase [Fructobacillus cardui]